MIKVPCKALPDKILSTQIRLTSLSIFRIKDINDTMHINKQGNSADMARIVQEVPFT